MPASSIPAPQLRRLDERLKRIAVAGPSYYQRALESHGVATVESFSELPATRYADLVRDQLGHPPQGSRRAAEAPHAVRAGWLRRGSDLLVLTWTAADLAHERACGVRVLSALGVTAGMRVANTLPGALATPGSLLLGDVMEDLGALDVPLGSIESAAQAKQAWELIDRVEPQVIVAESNGSDVFFNGAGAQPRPWWQGMVWVRSEICSARPALPAHLGFAGWQRTCLSIPVARSFAAAECDAGQFHFDAELCPEEGGGADRRHGLLLTVLAGDTPLLRYDTELLARGMGRCTCGATGEGYEVGG